MRRLLLCLVVGVLCGAVGGYVGLRVAGTSTQHASAGDARVSILPSTHRGLVVHVHDPTAELRFQPWKTPIAVDVDLLRTDDLQLGRAAFGSTASRDALVAAARSALQNALIRAAEAALVGALAVGLLGGLLVALVTRARGSLVATAFVAVVLCVAALVAGGLQTRSTIDRAALSRPTCPVVPQASLSAAVRGALGGTRPSQRTIRSLALRAVCSPAFAQQLVRARGQARTILG